MSCSTFTNQNFFQSILLNLITPEVISPFADTEHPNSGRMAETLAPNKYIRLLKQKCPPDLDAELATIISDKSKSITDKFDDFVDLMREHGSAGPLPKLSDVSTTSP